MRVAACLSSARPVLLALGCALLLGCRELDDCRLYNTCSGDLITLAKKMAGADGEQECEDCLEDQCEQVAAACSVDVQCNFTARCRIASTAEQYQSCLSLLAERGYTGGTERRRPWEGEEKYDFGGCVHGPCKRYCSQARFDCDNALTEYEFVSIWLSVRLFPNFDVASDAWIRACWGNHESDCSPRWEKTDQNGILKLDRLEKPEQLPPSIPANTLHFELKPSEASAIDFPFTIYYPGRLGRTGRQLVPVYLVSSSRIALGNAKLGRGEAVLTEAAQSLILPDSCIWEESSAPGVVVTVEDEDVPQCADPDASCSSASCAPCVWYAVGSEPSPRATRTDGTGAGIVGMSPGLHTIRVNEASTENFVSRREVRMEAGAMTIVRTWPQAEPDAPSPP